MKAVRKLGVGAAIAVSVVLALWQVPILLYPDLSDNATQGLSREARLSAIDKRLSLQSSSRTGLAQILGGLVLFAGAVAAWTSYRHDIADARAQRRHDQRVLLAQQFNTAVGHLADPHSDVRVAAAFALGDLTESDESYRRVIAEVLATFVGSRSKWPPTGDRPPADADLEALQELRMHAPDVQAALRVLGRHTYRWYGGEKFRFRYADLRRVNLSATHFEAAAFTEAHMERAWLRGAQLRYASFRDADLSGATLDNADLRDANLRGAVLADASLLGTALEGATFDSTTIWPISCSAVEAVSRGAREVDQSAQAQSVEPSEVEAL